MAPEKKTNVCAVCGSKSVWKMKSTPVEYQGETRHVQIAAWWCTNCDEAVLDGPALQAMTMARAKLKAEVDRRRSLERHGASASLPTPSPGKSRTPNH